MGQGRMYMDKANAASLPYNKRLSVSPSEGAKKNSLLPESTLVKTACLQAEYLFFFQITHKSTSQGFGFKRINSKVCDGFTLCESMFNHFTCLSLLSPLTQLWSLLPVTPCRKYSLTFQEKQWMLKGVEDKGIPFSTTAQDGLYFICDNEFRVNTWKNMMENKHKYCHPVGLWHSTAFQVAVA